MSKRRRTTKHSHSFYQSFTLPVVGSKIGVRVENKGGQLKNCGYTHWIYGKVLAVQHTAHYCTISAIYLDKKDYPGFVIKRTDVIKYEEYGRHMPRNWHVLTPEGAMSRGLCIKLEGVRIDITNESQPLSTRLTDDQLPIDECLECAVCKDPSEMHPCQGTMIICSSCNNGFHIGCLCPKLSSVPDGKWDCDACQMFGNF